MMTDAGKLRILVVDDEAPLVKMLGVYLSRDPRFALTLRTDSVEAARLVHEESFDLLITDYQMPQVCGAQLSRIARECQPAIRVIAISGHSIENEARDWCDLFVAKPFELPALGAAIERVRARPAARRAATNANASSVA